MSLGGKRAPLIAGVAAAVVALGLVFLFVLPKMNEVSTAQDALIVAEEQEQTLLARKGALESAQAEAPENEATIAAVQQRIPEVADEAGLLLLLENAAVSAGLSVSQFTLTEPVYDATSGLSIISIQVQGEGTYFQIADFLYNVETLPRAAKVLTTDLSTAEAATGTTPTLAVGASIQAYTTDADPELPGPQSVDATEVAG